MDEVLKDPVAAAPVAATTIAERKEVLKRMFIPRK
jgi:hypothetical protein